MPWSERPQARLVVARFKDGRVLKGATRDFLPDCRSFQIEPVATPGAAVPATVFLSDLKAVFFVKSLQGNARRRPDVTGPAKPSAAGKLAAVRFRDGEVAVGTVGAAEPRWPGFFLDPLDASDNNELSYILQDATETIRVLAQNDSIINIVENLRDT